MANIESQRKRNRQNEKRREKNSRVKSAIRSAYKKVIKAIEGSESKEAAQKLLQTFTKTVDTAAGKRVIKSKTADRKKSRLAKKINKLTTQA